jgi:choline dehydrogenase-like flavoprotein
MPKDTHEYLIVGSGAGGATLARELSRRGKRVLLLEIGRRETSVGTYRDSMRYYDRSRWTRLPARSREGVILWRTLMAGGTTLVSTGCATRCLGEQLEALDIDLSEEWAEVEHETNAAPIPERLLSDASRRIMSHASELGYSFEPIPKFIDMSRCKRCGNCALGCVHGARWSALSYLDEAIQMGAEVVYNASVRRVVVEDNRATGVVATSPHGEVVYRSDAVVLAAGALGTPVILQESGVQGAGHGLFGDVYVVTVGLIAGLKRSQGPTLPLVDLEFRESKGFILMGPYVIPGTSQQIRIGSQTIGMLGYQPIGIMIKIADEAVGQVFLDGSVSKPVTEQDWTRLREGSSIARGILIKAGAHPRLIVTSAPMAANLGGTAAIGQVVDRRLQTEIEGLFVCDGSVLPAPPGMPSILTIVALAKRLAKQLVSKADEETSSA